MMNASGSPLDRISGTEVLSPEKQALFEVWALRTGEKVGKYLRKRSLGQEDTKEKVRKARLG